MKRKADDGSINQAGEPWREENKEGSATDTDLERLTLTDLTEAMGSTVCQRVPEGNG